MSRPCPTVAHSDREKDVRSIRTGLAFLFAPGIAAIVGGVLLAPMLAGGHPDLGLVAIAAMLFAVVSYPTALVLAAPVYLALPESARGGGVIVPLAGALAAFPWAVASALTGGTSPEYIAAVIAFGLGCVGGLAFWAIRRGWRP